MTAKEYLQQIRILDLKINQKQREFDTLNKGRIYLNGVNYASERVQASSERQGFTKMSDRLVDLQMEINEEIDRFQLLRHHIINEIHQLSKSEYIDILYRRYIDYSDFEKIASDMGYSYYWACHLHGEALKEFSEKFGN